MSSDNTKLDAVGGAIVPPEWAKWGGVEQLTDVGWSRCVAYNRETRKPLKWFPAEQFHPDARRLVRRLFATGTFRIIWGKMRRRTTETEPFRVVDDAPATATPPPEPVPIARSHSQQQPDPPLPTAAHASTPTGVLALPPNADPALVNFLYIEGLVQQRTIAHVQMLQQSMALMLESERNRSREAIETAREHYQMLAASQERVHTALAQANTQTASSELTQALREMGETQRAMVQRLDELDDETDQNPEQMMAALMAEPSKLEVFAKGLSQLAAVAVPLVQQWQQAKVPQNVVGSHQPQEAEE